jgi:hypothetical protein
MALKPNKKGFNKDQIRKRAMIEFEIEIDLRGKLKVKRKIKKVNKDDDEREHKP